MKGSLLQQKQREGAEWRSEVTGSGDEGGGGGGGAEAATARAAQRAEERRRSGEECQLPYRNRAPALVCGWGGGALRTRKEAELQGADGHNGCISITIFGKINQMTASQLASLFGSWWFWYWAPSWLLFGRWASVEAVKSELVHCHQTSLWTCRRRRHFPEFQPCARDKSGLCDLKRHLSDVRRLNRLFSVRVDRPSKGLAGLCLIFSDPAAPQIHLAETKRHVALFQCARSFTLVWWCKYAVDVQDAPGCVHTELMKGRAWTAASVIWRFYFTLVFFDDDQMLHSCCSSCQRLLVLFVRKRCFICCCAFVHKFIFLKTWSIKCVH